MANLSIYAISIAFLALLAGIFFIYYILNELEEKKAFIFLVILILIILILGAFMVVIVKRSNDVPPIVGQIESESENNSYEDPCLHSEMNSNIIDAESFGRFLYSLTPMDKVFVKEKDKFFSPDWLLIVLSLLGNAIFIYYSYTQFFYYIESCIKLIIYLTIWNGVFSFAHFYMVFYIASFFSLFAINRITLLGIVLAVLEYSLIICMFVLLFFVRVILDEMLLIDFWK